MYNTNLTRMSFFNTFYVIDKITKILFKNFNLKTKKG